MKVDVELDLRLQMSAGNAASLDIGPTSAEAAEQVAEKEADTGDEATREIGEEAARLTVAVVEVVEAAVVVPLTWVAQMNCGKEDVSSARRRVISKETAPTCEAKEVLPATITTGGTMVVAATAVVVTPDGTLGADRLLDVVVVAGETTRLRVLLLAAGITPLALAHLLVATSATLAEAPLTSEHLVTSEKLNSPNQLT